MKRKIYTPKFPHLTVTNSIWFVKLSEMEQKLDLIFLGIYNISQLWLSCFWFFGFLASKDLFWLSSLLSLSVPDKDISKTRRIHYNRYLSFFFNDFMYYQWEHTFVYYLSNDVYSILFSIQPLIRRLSPVYTSWEGTAYPTGTP